MPNLFPPWGRRGPLSHLSLLGREGADSEPVGKNLQVDHIVPQAHGGTDHTSNRQLLYGHCNSTKGTGTMAELKARLHAMGVGTMVG